MPYSSEVFSTIMKKYFVSDLISFGNQLHHCEINTQTIIKIIIWIKIRRGRRGGGGTRRRRRRSRESEDLRIKKQCRWKVNTMITAVISTIRTVSKSFPQYLSKIPGKHKTKEVQKTAILGTVNLIQKELM